MKTRTCYQFSKNVDDKWLVNELEMNSPDEFDGEILIALLPLLALNETRDLLLEIGLSNDTEHFKNECKQVIAVAENHQSPKGGKMSFQSLFHNIPESILSVNNKGYAVVAFHKLSENSSNPNYRIIGYAQAVSFDFKHPNYSELQPGFYGNMLRVSEHLDNGVAIYRRKKIFSLMFAALLRLGENLGIDYAFACVGKENESIKQALDFNVKHTDYKHELFRFTM
ncbi:MAG: hypothetical protein KDC92_15730, partial [Bacteroidetes bacterium]|nr:hypothetical protein [Bacteroidota bacterium]